MDLKPLNQEQCLQELMPRVQNYQMPLALLRRLCQRNGGSYPARPYSYLVRAGIFKQDKPYFIGKTASGVSFLGDFRDWYSIMSTISLNSEREFVDLIVGQLKATQGGYLDAGANMGLLAASVVHGLQDTRPVYAFEPVPQTSVRTAATCALNQMAHVNVFQAAVGDADSEITFYVAGTDSLSSSVYPAVDKAWQEIKVPCVTVNSLMEKGILGSIGMMKLDVEGNELRAIQGAMRLIERDRPTILYEYHPDIASKVGWVAEDVANLIRAVPGYEFDLLFTDGSQSKFPISPDKFVNVLCINAQRGKTDGS